MDRNTFTIGVLSITAVILLVGILVIGSMPAPAVAVGMNDRGGDYLVVTSYVNTGTELVFVIDAATARMVAYTFDINARLIDMWDGVDLTRFTRQPKERAPGGRR